LNLLKRFSKKTGIGEKESLDKEIIMNCYVASTPRDVFHFLADYLLPVEEQQKHIFKYSFDLRNFVNTNKRYFGEWKKKTRVMVLMTAKAELFANSSIFRNRVLSMIEDPMEQLELQFLYRRLTEVSLNFGGVRKVSVECGKIHNVSISCNHIVFRNCIVKYFQDCPSFRKFEFRDCSIHEGDLSSMRIREEPFLSPSHPPNLQILGHLKFLTLYNSMSLVDVSCLRNISKLEFVGCPNIKDISTLKDVRELSFGGCDGIVDISSLGRVHKLAFSCCDNIRDVSALGNVHILDIAYCRGISDVSALGNVSELHLTHCYQVTDISALKHVKEVRLGEFNGTDVSGLETVERLFLMGCCPGVTDLSMLNNVRVLDVQGCRGLASSQFSGLRKLRDLRYLGVSTRTLFDFSILERLSNFESTDMDFSATDGNSRFL
jgi:Leucine-rich repeat (LRR) protein